MLVPIRVPAFPDTFLVNILWILGWILGGSIQHRLVTINAIRPVLALHRQAMEVKPSQDGS